MEKFIVWISASVLVTAICNAIFRITWFQQEKNYVKNAKYFIQMGVSVLYSVAYVLLNNLNGLFGIFGYNVYPILDAVGSGLIISLGADFVYQIYATIVNFKQMVENRKEISRVILNEKKRL